MDHRFEIFKPSPVLSRYIRKYYLFEGPNTGVTNRIPAWTKAVMVLQCGGRLGADFDKGYENIKPASINGSVLTPYTYDTDSPFFKFFVIEFTSFGLYALFRESTKSFLDTSVDVFDVIPMKKKLQLVEALSELEDMAKKVEIVEQFLKQFLPDENDLFRIRHVIDTINIVEGSMGTVTVDQISKELNFTSKHITEGMNEVTGMSTKQFATLTRFQYAFNAVVDGTFDFNTFETALSYHDQSHFIKEFKRYTGYAPKKLPKETYMFSRLFNLG